MAEDAFWLACTVAACLFSAEAGYLYRWRKDLRIRAILRRLLADLEGVSRDCEVVRWREVIDDVVEKTTREVT